MRTAIALSQGLRDEDIQWLFQVGEEKAVHPGTALVHEGVRPNAIFIVIRGRFSVGVETFAGEPLAELGVGELIGEISFLEGSPASATIEADEESAALVVQSGTQRADPRRHGLCGSHVPRVCTGCRTSTAQSGRPPGIPVRVWEMRW